MAGVAAANAQMPPPASGQFSARKVFGNMFSLRASPVAVPANVTRPPEGPSHSARTMSSPSLVVSSSALLFVAAKAGDVDQVRRLVESLGSGTDATSLRNAAQMSQTPLHVTPSVACARLLTARLPGLVDVVDDDGALPLHTAIRQMRFEVALHLLGLPGADAHCGRGRCRSAPLHLLGGVPWTASKDAARVFDTLLALGASLSERDRNGRSPLHHAAEHGNLNCVAAIIAQGDQSLLYATDSNGNTPLVSAARGGHVDVLRMLIRDADKSKLDVARAVATAQQWQRTAALDVLGARTQGVATTTNNAGGGGVQTSTSPRNDMWSSTLADAPDVMSEDDAKSVAATSAIVAALPSLLELLQLAPARKHSRNKIRSGKRNTPRTPRGIGQSAEEATPFEAPPPPPTASRGERRGEQQGWRRRGADSRRGATIV
jgi:hypothetical protein